MATNRNKNTGNISAPQGANKNKGITSAIDQAGYRREFNERVFSDTGYIQSSIKDLQEQVAELEEVLSKSKELTKSEQTRYKNAVSNMKRLEAQLQQMYKSQDVSSNELFSTLNDSIKARQKAVDDLYKHYMNNEKELDKAGKEFVDKKIDYFAAKTRELKGVTEEINEASKKFNDSQKSFSDGMKETVSKATNTFKDLTNMFNIQSIAQNEYLEKANERYDIINKLNAQLGYGTNQSTQAYNNISQAFTDFNNQMGSLYNMDDMKQYLSNSASYGLINRDLLEKNLNATIVSQKYLGTSSETLNALYKFSRLTDNREVINKYNKTMIQLQKEGISVNKDMLDQMITQNADVASGLAAGGYSEEEISNFEDYRNQVLARIMDDENLGQDVAEGFNSYLNEILTNFSDPALWGNISKMSGGRMNVYDMMESFSNPQEFISKAYEGFRDYSGESGNIAYKQGIYSQINSGVDSDMINAIKEMRESNFDINSTLQASQESLDKIKSMTDGQANDYVEQNTAISDSQKVLNAVSTNVENLVGSWDGYNKLATTFFVTALAGNVIQGISGIANLASSIKSAGGIKGLFTNFFGKSSDLVKSTDAIDGQMDLFNSGGSASGKALSAITTVGSGIALGTAAVAAIGGAIDKSISKNDKKNIEAANEKWEGTNLEDNISANTISGEATTNAKENNNFFSDYGASLHSVTTGIGSFFKKTFQNDLAGMNANEYKLFRDNWQNREHNAEDTEKAMLAWRLLLDSANRLSDIGTGESRADLKALVQSGKFGNEYLLNNYADYIVNNMNKAPYKNKDERQTSIDWGNYHKAGLERVPKDNYKALLHKNEMVLNEKDADEYRAILKEKEKNKNVSGIITGNGFGTGGVIGGVEVGNYNENYVTNHSGLDLYFNQKGTPVGSAVGGSVITSKDITTKPNRYTGRNSEGYYSYGRYVEVLGDDGQKYIYAHLNERVAKVGQRVEPGTLLGYSGNTGNSTGPHLHFEIRGLGKGSAKHAKYYTHFVRDVNGVPSGESTDTNTSNTTGETSDTHIKLATPTTTSRRAIPGIGGSGIDESNTPKSNGVDRIVNSVDGVSAKIIKYLDEIRQEQESQRSLIRAFSNSQNMLDMRN